MGSAVIVQPGHVEWECVNWFFIRGLFLCVLYMLFFFSPDKKRESVIISFISYNRDKTTNNNEINLPRFFIGNVDSVSGRD